MEGRAGIVPLQVDAVLQLGSTSIPVLTDKVGGDTNQSDHCGVVSTKAEGCRTVLDGVSKHQGHPPRPSNVREGQ